MTEDETKATTKDEPEAEAKPKASKAAKFTGDIRHTVNSWWCPKDDTAMLAGVPVCSVCGFERPADEE